MKPRVLVLTLPQADQPMLKIAGQTYFLRNLSEEGIGLWVPPPLPEGIGQNSVLQADLRIGKENHTVTLEVIHLSPRLAGLKILTQSAELEARLKSLLEPSRYAAQLAAHPESGKVDPGEGLVRLWYRAGTAAELVAWYNPDSRLLEKLQICCLGRWVSRTLLARPKTGVLPDSALVAQGRVLTASELAHLDTEPLESSLQAAAQFLTAVPEGLPGALLWQFLETGEQIFLPEFKSAKPRVA